MPSGQYAEDAIPVGIGSPATFTMDEDTNDWYFVLDVPVGELVSVHIDGAPNTTFMDLYDPDQGYYFGYDYFGDDPAEIFAITVASSNFVVNLYDGFNYSYPPIGTYTIRVEPYTSSPYVGSGIADPLTLEPGNDVTVVTSREMPGYWIVLDGIPEGDPFLLEITEPNDAYTYGILYDENLEMFGDIGAYGAQEFTSPGSMYLFVFDDYSRGDPFPEPIVRLSLGDPDTLREIYFEGDIPTLGVGDTYQMQVVFVPPTALNKDLIWDIGDPNIISVSSTGLVTGLSPGGSSLRATSVDGGFYDETYFTVTMPVPGDSFTRAVELPLRIQTVTPVSPAVPRYHFVIETTVGVEHSVRTFGFRDTYMELYTRDQILVDYNDDTYGTNAAITFTPTDTLYYVVVRGYSTPSFEWNDVYTYLDVETDKPVTGVTLSPRDSSYRYALKLGTTQQFTATVAPANAGNKNVTWASGTPSVLTIDANGLATPVSYGRARITVTTEENGFTDFVDVTVSPFDGGGTQTNPFLISTPQDLDNIRYVSTPTATVQYYYKQTADINMASWGNFTPIGLVTGDNLASIDLRYDGAGHFINNLTVDASSQPGAAVGLFATVEGRSTFNPAEIKNLHLRRASVTTSSGAIGILAGYLSTGSVVDCSVEGEVIGTNSPTAGGLLGLSYRCTVERSSAEAVISGGITGGLIGYANTSSTIRDCYAIAEVTATDTRGGLIGIFFSGAVIRTYAATSGVLGGLLGNAPNSSYADSYYDSQVAGPNAGGYGQPRTTVQMKQQANFAVWDFDTIWTIREGQDYPRLRGVREDELPPQVVKCQSFGLRKDFLIRVQ